MGSLTKFLGEHFLGTETKKELSMQENFYREYVQNKFWLPYYLNQLDNLKLTNRLSKIIPNTISLISLGLYAYTKEPFVLTPLFVTETLRANISYTYSQIRKRLNIERKQIDTISVLEELIKSQQQKITSKDNKIKEQRRRILEQEYGWEQEGEEWKRPERDDDNLI